MTTASEIINKYQLQQKNWTHKGFHGILHFFFPVAEQVVKPFYEFYGDTYELVS